MARPRSSSFTYRGYRVHVVAGVTAPYFVAKEGGRGRMLARFTSAGLAEAWIDEMAETEGEGR